MVSASGFILGPESLANVAALSCSDFMTNYKVSTLFFFVINSFK